MADLPAASLQVSLNNEGDVSNKLYCILIHIIHTLYIIHVACFVGLHYESDRSVGLSTWSFSAVTLMAVD